MWQSERDAVTKSGLGLQEGALGPALGMSSKSTVCAVYRVASASTTHTHSDRSA